MEKFCILAPAKINLTLDIFHKRDDGYHEIETIMMPIDLCDTVFIEKNSSNKISVKTNIKEIPQDEKNICYNAAEEFFTYNNIKDKGISIYIDKKIPSKAGLAGGSTDAAATIILLNKMYKTGLSTNRLEEIAKEIGSDVPFCVRKKTTLAFGRGEILEDINTNIDFYIILVKPDVSSSTKLAYENFSKLKNKKVYDNKNVIIALKSGNLKLLQDNLFNVFEEIINVPEIKIIKDKLSNFGAKAISMSGSGTAVFGIFEEKKEAIKAYEKLIEEKNYMVFIQKPFYI